MLREILPRLKKPGRYLGCEVNSVHKDPSVRLRIALAFPDVYEVAFSHIGLKILYSVLNERSDIWAERVYAPWADMEQELRNSGLPLFSLESKTSLKNFELIGFTLQHELCITNVLNMLELSGIELRAHNRGPKDPIVIGGGPNASNPEPFADFFDAFVLGDGEEAILEIADALIETKDAGLSRESRLARLATIQGVYVPSLIEVKENDRGGSKAVNDEMIRRAFISDLDHAHYDIRPLTPTVEPVHDRYSIEIQRGCSRGCRFCQAGMIYRPTRQRSPKKVVELAREGLSASGQETLGMLSLSAGDYACLGQTASVLFEEHEHNHVSIQLPSLRVEALDEQLIHILNRERKTGFTLAPEAASERLRRVINKGNTEDDLLSGLEQVFAAGWRRVKLYFMIGLPTETDKDVEAIVELAHRVRLLGRRFNKANQVTASVSTFVPKAHTPFQWAGMITSEEIHRKQKFLREGLRAVKVAFKWHDRESTLLEAALARGGRPLSGIIESAFRRGARFDSWTELFDPELWRACFDEAGIDFESYISREFTPGEALPWSHLDYGVSEEFLRAEYEKALSAETGTDCTYGVCTNCGVCDHKTVGRRIFVAEDDDRASSHTTKPEPPTPRRHRNVGETMRVVRFRYEKADYSIYLGHLDVMTQISRAFRRSGIHLKYSEGFHPKPRISFSPALPLGVSSSAEFFDAEILDASPVSSLVDRLNGTLPRGMKILDARKIDKGTPSLNQSMTAINYRFNLGGMVNRQEIEEALERFENATSIPVIREGKKGQKVLEMKELIECLEIGEECTFSASFIIEGRSLKPLELVATLFGIDRDDYFKLNIEKTGVHFSTPKVMTTIGNSGKQDFRMKEKGHGPKTDYQRKPPGNTGGANGKRKHG